LIDKDLLEIKRDDEESRRIVWSWVPDKEYRDEMRKLYPCNDLAEAYAVVENPKSYFGIMIYGKYRDEWSPNPRCARPVVAKMLEEMRCRSVK
jgi:hypothetical protein